jgi:hypothetical protein
MKITDWTSPQAGRLPYTYDNFAKAKVFVFSKWCESAVDCKLTQPTDLSGSCKYGSLFMQYVFGGTIRGHYEHQYNFINGRLVDLSHDAIDVGRMSNPYLHEPDYFVIPEFQASLTQCSPRAEQWAEEFLGNQRVRPN